MTVRREGAPTVIEAGRGENKEENVIDFRSHLLNTIYIKACTYLYIQLNEVERGAAKRRVIFFEFSIRGHVAKRANAISLNSWNSFAFSFLYQRCLYFLYAVLRNGRRKF